MEAARVAVAADLPDARWVLASVSDEQATHRGGSIFYRREAVRAEDRLSEALASGDAVVGTYDGVVFGYGIGSVEQLEDGSKLGRIEALAVVADARGSGIGEAMMNLLLETLEAAGCFGVDSTALPGDRSTKNFFESFGLKARMLSVHRSF